MLRVELPEWSEPLFRPSRYKSLHGGRGSAKSWTVAGALLVQALEKPLRVLCTRELQVSIKDSVHRLLADLIGKHGLGGPNGYPYNVLNNEIRAVNGSLFLFEGIKHNVSKIKSLEGIDRLWVEEAQSVSEESWQTVIPTIRKPGSEIWLIWNPYLDTDPTYKRFIVSPPPDCWSLEVNWDRNPWLSDELRREKDYLYSVDPEAAAHVWGGKTVRVTGAQVLRGRYVVESFEPGKDWSGPHYGADWGFSVDPTTLIRCWVNQRTLYVEHEAYAVGCDLDDTPALFDTVPEAKKHTIRADSSRPETISHMRRHGFMLLPATKGPGSVEDGVEHLRSYERIVIHPRCTNTAQEARLWSYKTDRLSGDVLPKLDDKHDHCWDAVRYALEPIIQRGRPRKHAPPPPKKRHDYDDRGPATNGWKLG